MSRWYQNGLTGEQREVKTFEEEDALSQPWSRIPGPPDVPAPAPAPKPAPVKKPASKKG